MKHDSTLDKQHAQSESRFPSPGVRTAASLLLFVHLFAVVIAMTSRATTVDTEFGPAGSELLARMRRVPFLMAYLQLLELDESYNFAWTQGDPLDAVHSIEVELEFDDPNVEQLVIRIPQDRLRPPLRNDRHHNLALTAAALVGRDDRENILPQAVAENFVREHGATGGTIRIRRHFPQSPPEAASLDEAVADPFNDRYYATPYEARILVTDGVVSLLKSESPGTSAPAAGRAATVPLPPSEASP